MATPPDFSPGQVLTAAHMDAVGLWLVKTETIGTAVSSVPVSNCFSSDFQNYRIIIENESTNGSAQHTLQLQGITTSSYFTGGSFGSWTIAGQTGYGPAASTSWYLSANVAASVASNMVLDLFNPNVARRKFGTVMSQAANGHATWNLLCTSTSTATGFTLGKGADTMTGGVIRVYGYRN
jgi:hypothetical protein